MLPKAAELPEYATRSPPPFYLTNAEAGSGALGIPMGYDCAANEIPIEYQSSANSTRQQFKLTYDHQLVNSACPNKALVADCARKRLAFRDTIVNQRALAKFLKISVSGRTDNSLNLVEVQVFDTAGTNRALASSGAIASQSTTYQWGHITPCYASIANDGNITEKSGIPCNGNAATIDVGQQNGWWQVDMQNTYSISRVVIYNRPSYPVRLSHATVSLLDENGNAVARVADIGDASNRDIITLNSGDFSVIRQTDTWLLNEDGSIANVECPNLKLSSTKNSINVLISNYFSLVNPTTGLVMGIEDMSKGCVNGMNIVLQNAAEGNPNQLFYMKGGEIISLACPNSALSVSDASKCNSNTSVIQLKTSDGNSTWQFNNDTTIQSRSLRLGEDQTTTAVSPTQQCDLMISQKGSWCSQQGTKLDKQRCGGVVDASNPATHLVCTDNQGGYWSKDCSTGTSC
jgi:hypothetical protein